MTQRFVPGGGKSVIVSGLPSGPSTYFGLGRTGIVMKPLAHTTEQFSEMLRELGENLLKAIEQILDKA
jgi:hypothetical protein